MRLQKRLLVLIDLILVLAAAVGAFVIRYEALIRVMPYIRYNAYFFATVLIVRPLIYYLFGLYRYWWRYASLSEMVAIIESVTVGSLITAAIVFGILAPQVEGIRTFSRSVLLLEWMLNLLAIGASRILLRLLQSRQRTYESQCDEQSPLRPVLIMGAGDAGALIVREMLQTPSLGFLPVGFIDDDPQKQNEQIYGISVLGTRDDIPQLAQDLKIRDVVIAMPTAPGVAIRAVRTICEQVGVEAKTIPGLYELIRGSVNISEIRPVKIEDLLRREPIRTDLAAVEGYVQGATILVTGAGGSIGSELCRQILARRPQRLLVLGHGENSIYHITMELRKRTTTTEIVPIIADVRDADRIQRIMTKYHPSAIFHAAAHKHVPLMEDNMEEALTTNVLGTHNLLKAAEMAGTQRFVMISSDKAVNAVNIMGASKRLAEILVQHAARRTSRPFVAVRFGNVLGSRGSVVPLFERQIANGGPVTVTHPDMVRFFMTIPEAVQLVLQAATLGHGGEIFVLEMGDQIRIVDLSRDLISLSGLTPDKDIEITFTGIRPGEKLEEELFGGDETPAHTSHEKILLTHSTEIMSEEQLLAGIQVALEAAQRDNRSAFDAAMSVLIPSFTTCHDGKMTISATPANKTQLSPTTTQAAV